MNITFAVVSDSVAPEKLNVFSMISQRLSSEVTQFIPVSHHLMDECPMFYRYYVEIEQERDNIGSIDYSLKTNDLLVNRNEMPIRIKGRGGCGDLSDIASELARERKSSAYKIFDDGQYQDCAYFVEREKALALRKGGDFFEAQKKINDMIRQYPDRADLHYYLSKICMDMDAMDCAMLSAKKSIALEKGDNIYFLRNIAGIYKKIGSMDDSLFYYKKALALDKSNARSYLELISAYNHISNFPEVKPLIVSTRAILGRKDIYEKSMIFRSYSVP